MKFVFFFCVSFGVWNVYWYIGVVVDEVCVYQFGYVLFMLWFMGLSGVGKFIFVYVLEKCLYEMCQCCVVFDGDNLCYYLNYDFGFIEVDCIENLCCVVEVVCFMNDVGLIVVMVFILLLCFDCEMVCEIIGVDWFVEVYVCIMFDVCEVCDLKGLYVWV